MGTEQLLRFQMGCYFHAKVLCLDWDELMLGLRAKICGVSSGSRFLRYCKCNQGQRSNARCPYVQLVCAPKGTFG